MGGGNGCGVIARKNKGWLPDSQKVYVIPYKYLDLDSIGSSRVSENSFGLGLG